MVGLAVAKPGQSQSMRAGQLDPRIGEADQRKYESIRDASDWKNPHLTIRHDGVAVTASGLPDDGKIIGVADLRKALVALPVASWPYGRVVAVAEIGILRGDGSDRQLIAENLRAAIATLTALKIRVERWPG